MKTVEILEKVENLAQNLAKLDDCELNRIAGYVEGLIAFKELKTQEEKEPA